MSANTTPANSALTNGVVFVNNVVRPANMKNAILVPAPTNPPPSEPIVCGGGVLDDDDVRAILEEMNAPLPSELPSPPLPAVQPTPGKCR